MKSPDQKDLERLRRWHEVKALEAFRAMGDRRASRHTVTDHALAYEHHQYAFLLLGRCKAIDNGE